MREPGRDLPRDFAKGEAVETELDQFISKRHAKSVASEGERATEAAWAETERREAARRRSETREGWHEWHAHRAELYAALARQVDPGRVEQVIPKVSADHLQVRPRVSAY